jgi:VIT1/CCC1 family predicted Fe2+/Mn2+ transporter
MSRLHVHPESHLVERVGWLRAAVLGANDGIASTASLIVGVAAAAVVKNDVLITGVAGLVAGAMSMAAGRATLRVTFWGALAMALTAGIGRIFGTTV